MKPIQISTIAEILDALTHVQTCSANAMGAARVRLEQAVSALRREVDCDACKGYGERATKHSTVAIPGRVLPVDRFDLTACDECGGKGYRLDGKYLFADVDVEAMWAERLKSEEQP